MPLLGLYDFSGDSGIKESLFEDMQKVFASSKRQTASPREPLSFEELAGGELRPGPAAPPKAHDPAKPAAEKDFGKS